ncbi:prepilin-type N-terminal cleavage/methylation domain-containing protein [uncultured Ruminococcus sp.]|jgi:prepilin-type N-terminal cleavage/methylation domain-containing protein|uniref:PulJ/GspJ family protein n=1 Tax=uncultured Ruminococcus sp. TaxID=165186 RepID=UPI0025FCBB98|nr:prepilin-type N-terminal cleavage/methylation domain-containing protein [uncultured Ruminococcus sp.]
MKKGKKTVKGMTLIEMIISIAVLAMLCVILAMVGQNIDATARATNTLKDKVSKESPYAANGVAKFNGNAGEVEFATQTGTMVVRVPGNYSFNDVPYPDPSVNFNIARYDTEQIVLDGKSAKERNAIQNGPNGGLNLRFYQIVTTAAATTTAPTTTTAAAE